MGQIFLSYARPDSARAAKIARTLEDAGHTVWWDQQIRAGSRFTKEIDKALKKADAIVVLWSKASVESAWVHDEAAAGRDSDRLVPVLIDPIDPPLGFRQYQAIDLSRSAHSAKTYQQLATEVARLTHGERQPEAARGHRPPSRISWRWIAAFLILLAVIAGLWALLGRPGGSGRSVAIVADGGDMPMSRQLAKNIALDLGRYRIGQLRSLIILPDDKHAENAAYRVGVGVSGGGREVFVDLALSTTEKPEQLWTASLKGEPERLVDIRQQAAASLGNVLSCLGEVQAQRTKLSQEVLGLYLTGCGKLSDLQTDAPGEDVFSIFRQLTEKAPEFAPGWATLALVQIQSWPSTPPEDLHQLVLSARANLKRAKELDPDLPVVFAADAYLPEHSAPGAALPIVEQGLQHHPDSAILHDARSTFLSQVGRTNDAISEAQRAMELDPLSPLYRDTFISALAYAGRTKAAFDELAKAESIWPGSTVLQQVRYRLDLRYGDPRNALKLLEQRGSGDARPIPMDTAWKRFLEARMAPTPARIDTALQDFRHRKSGGDWGYLQALGTFGRVDEAFRALESEEAIDAYSGTPDAFFRIHMRPIYSDPRFMRVAQRLDLLKYWQSSGRWPDFCRDPKLPYDCKQVAQQLRIARAG